MINGMIKKIFGAVGLTVGRKIAVDYKLWLYKKLYSEESIRKKRFYNIGAGAFYHPCWTNIDHLSRWYEMNIANTFKGIDYDLFSLESIPVESDAAEIIYTSHTIEHVNNEAVQNLFNESFRMLKKGGIIRIVTPDIDLSYRAYKENDRDFYYWIDWYSSDKDYKRVNIRQPLNKETTAQIFLEDFASQASEIPLHGSEKRLSDEEIKKLFEEKSFEEALDYCISFCRVDVQKQYPENHLNWFTEKKLRQMLENAGFKIIYRSAYGQSHSPALRDLNFFDCTMPPVSMYMEAKK